MTVVLGFKSVAVAGDTSMSAASSASLQMGLNDASAFVRDRPDEGDYKWAQDSYNSTQRTIDTWYERRVD